MVKIKLDFFRYFKLKYNAKKNKTTTTNASVNKAFLLQRLIAMKEINCCNRFMWIFKCTSQHISEALHNSFEFIKSLELLGVPLHRSEVKVGLLNMLIKNINPRKLCNWTCPAVNQFLSHRIKANILAEESKKDHVFLHRILIIPVDLPFEFKRLQFLVMLRFAMTMNKSNLSKLLTSNYFPMLFPQPTIYCLF